MAKTLEKMSLKELQEHQRAVDDAIRDFEKKKRAEALAEARAAAKKHGFVLEELLTAKSGKGGPKGVPRFANPADPTMTWTGKGRQPNWVKDALAAGKALEDLAI